MVGRFYHAQLAQAGDELGVWSHFTQAGVVVRLEAVSVACFADFTQTWYITCSIGYLIRFLIIPAKWGDSDRRIFCIFLLLHSIFLLSPPTSPTLTDYSLISFPPHHIS